MNTTVVMRGTAAPVAPARRRADRPKPSHAWPAWTDAEFWAPGPESEAVDPDAHVWQLGPAPAPPRFDTPAKVRAALLAALGRGEMTTGELLWKALDNAVPARLRDEALEALRASGLVESREGTASHRRVTLWRLTPAARTTKAG